MVSVEAAEAAAEAAAKAAERKRLLPEPKKTKKPRKQAKLS